MPNDYLCRGLLHETTLICGVIRRLRGHCSSSFLLHLPLRRSLRQIHKPQPWTRPKTRHIIRRRQTLHPPPKLRAQILQEQKTKHVLTEHGLYKRAYYQGGPSLKW
jgi:hypothetical protein